MIEVCDAKFGFSFSLRLKQNVLVISLKYEALKGDLNMVIEVMHLGNFWFYFSSTDISS